MIDVESTFDWLVDGCDGVSDLPDAIAMFGRRLRNDGIPVDRLAAFLRTLHPNVSGRGLIWSPDQPVRVLESSFAESQSPAFQQNPATVVSNTGVEMRVRVGIGEMPHASLRSLAAEGFTDWLMLPMKFVRGGVHAVSYATKAPGGFTEEMIAALRRVTRPLCRIAEVISLSGTAANLLDAYVGPNAGSKILSGKIHLGDTELIRAALWFSDLRGFTSMSMALKPGDMIAMLNEVFGCQVPVIERHGGEVLKFIGDGLLAIFPVKEDRSAAACDHALDAATEALAALEKLNADRTSRGQQAIAFGIGLHLGEVAYGNIGGSNRVDFTCIGAAVNLASRIEGLTRTIGRPTLVSAEFAQATTRSTEVLGAFELKGFPDPIPVSAPLGR